MRAPKDRYHLNPRAALILTVIGLTGALGLYILQGYQEKRILKTALEQVKSFREASAKATDPEQKSLNNDLALRHLVQYLQALPDDPEGLQIEAELLFAGKDLRGATSVYEHLLRLPPAVVGTKAQDARRQLAEMYILMSDYYRLSLLARLMPEDTAKQFRYHTAESHAFHLLEANANANPPVDEAKAHRLHAMALEGQLIAKDSSRRVELYVRGRLVKDKSLLEAITLEYQAALALDPGDMIAAQRLADIHRRSENMAAAREVLDGLLKAHPYSVDVRSIRYLFLGSIGDSQAAAAELEEALLIDPENLGLTLTAAENALRLGFTGTREARYWLDQLPRSSRNDPRAYLMKGMIEYTEQDYEAALGTWRKGLEQSNGSDIGLTQRLALILFELGRDDEAAKVIVEYRRLVSDTDPVLRFFQGIQDERAGRFSRAIERLEWARDRLPEGFATHVYLILARCHERQGNTAEAEKTYRAALQLDPRSVPLMQSLGRLLANTQPEEAVKEFERGLVTTPNHPGLLISLAEARFQQQKLLSRARRNWADFDAVFKRAATAAPTNTALVLLNAERLAADGQFDKAISFLREAVAKSPKSPELAFRLAEYLLGQGRPDESLEVLARASDPKAAGDRGLLRVQRALALTSLGQGREARTALVRDIDRLSAADRDEVWRFLVLLCKGQGDPEMTRAAYNEWARLLRDDARPKFALLEMEIEANDQKAISARLESLRPPDNQGDIQGDFMWRLARARLRLSEAKEAKKTSDEKRRKGLLKEADTLEKSSKALLKEADTSVESVLHDFKIDAVALLLKGQILEAEGARETAADCYGQAWARGNVDALFRLVDLWTRLGRKAELERLRLSDKTKQLDQLEAMSFLAYGDKNEASRIIQQSLSEQTVMQPWQVGLLEFLGEDTKAESTLRTIAEQQSDKLEPWLALLRFQASHRPPGTTDEAKHRQKLEATIAETKKRVKIQWPELIEAECRRAVADLSAADKAFEGVAKNYPEVDDVQAAAARYFEERGRLGAAEACLRSILARHPNDRTIMRQLAVVISGQGERHDAVKQAIELLGPETASTQAPEERLARAIVLGRSGDLTRMKEAIELLRAVVADLPADNTRAVAAREMLARILLATGQPLQASRVAAISAARGNNTTAIALYAETLLQSKQFDEAEGVRKRLAWLDPHNVSLANLRAREIQGRAKADEGATALEEAYLAIKDKDKAEAGKAEAEAFGREAIPLILGMGPTARPVAERLGRHLAKENAALSWIPALILAQQPEKRDETLALCQKTVETGKTPVDIREACRIALEVAVASRTDPATLKRVHEIVDQAMQHAPENDELCVLGAMVNHLVGRFDEEVRLYRALLVHLPRNPVVLNNIAWALSEGLNQPSEAMEKIDTLIEVTGRSAESLDTRGVILMRLQRFDEAVKDLEEAVRAAPTGSHHFHLSQVYKKMGRDDDSRRALEAAQRGGLTPTTVDPTERAELEALLKL